MYNPQVIEIYPFANYYDRAVVQARIKVLGLVAGTVIKTDVNVVC